MELEKECDFSDFITELLMSTSVTSITDKKLLDNLLKKKVNCAKKSEKKQQNTYHRDSKIILHRKH